MCRFYVILIISVFALRMINKQQQVNHHNQIINDDKAKALATFKAFVEATDNPLMKEVLLQQASNAAFSTHSTGYGTSNPVKLPPTVQLAEKVISKTVSDFGSTVTQ